MNECKVGQEGGGCKGEQGRNECKVGQGGRGGRQGCCKANATWRSPPPSSQGGTIEEWHLNGPLSFLHTHTHPLIRAA